MDLTDVVFRPPTGCAQKPCCSIPNTVNSVSLHLSYRDGWVSLQEHKMFMDEQIRRRNNNNTRTTIVAYLSWNTIDFFFSVLACMKCQHTIPALLNARWTAQEIVNVLVNGGGKHEGLCLCFAPEFASVAQAVASNDRVKERFATSVQLLPIPRIATARLKHHHGDMECSSKNDESCRQQQQQHQHTLSRDTALILFTSGTTSIAKGVELSHDAIFQQARAKCLLFYTNTTRMLGSTVPFFHVGGLSSIMAVWMAGGTLVLPEPFSSHFHPARALTGQANTLVVVPTMLFLLQRYYFKGGVENTKKTFPDMKLILIGGQSATEQLLTFTRRIFPNARIVQTYACTEASSSLTFLDVTTTTPTRTGGGVGDCVGTPHVPVAVFQGDHMVTRPHVMGTIATRGPHVMNGYWGQETITKDSWFRTSDLGCWDEQGQLYFCGRETDSIRTGGETVLAHQVEQCLALNPAVEACAVFAMKDEKFGERVCCAIVSGEEITLGIIRKWCTDQGLAVYKQPRMILHVRELPKNSSGKVQKFRLVQQAEKVPSTGNRTLSKL